MQTDKAKRKKHASPLDQHVPIPSKFQPPLPDLDPDPITYKDPDLLLPIANVARLMKMVLPNYAKISKEAKEYVQECVTELIAFVSAEAIERCTADKRKTLSGEDILYALNKLDFETYSDALTIYLRRLREVIKNDKSFAATFQDYPNMMENGVPMENMLFSFEPPM